MTVLLTGARGFLGSRVLARLHARGEEVITLGRTVPSTPGRHITTDLGLHRDPMGLQRIAAVIGDVDWICHLAADVPRDGSRDRALACFETNVLGTIMLLDAFARPGQHNVIASSLEASLPPRTWYGSSKLAMEHACRTWQARHPGVKLAMLRFTTLYGPGDTIDRAIPNWVKAAREGRPMRVNNLGRDVRDYLHVEDAASAVLHARNLDGTYEIGTGVGISMADVATEIDATVPGSNGWIANETTQGRPSTIVADPAAFMHLTHWAPTRRFPDGLL